MKPGIRKIEKIHVQSRMRDKRIYRTTDLFGNEEIRFVEGKKNINLDLFNNYDDFLLKFESKKTTDDCYTPPEVFEIVLNYVREKYGLDGKEIIRPFYPAGDYENIAYPDNCVVIDNPPFSILSQIIKFYVDRNIKFFLFAPHLTLFSSDIDCTHIVVNANITYENGALVKTSFLSNMMGEAKIIGDAVLFGEFRKLEERRVNLPKYQYPVNVLTVSQVARIVQQGISIQIDKKDVKHCRRLDDQKKHNKGIFGSGFLLSEKAAAEKAAAEKAAAEKAASEKDETFYWKLSKQEIDIIKSLGK